MDLKEKPSWSKGPRPEILVWFKKHIDDINHVEIRPRWIAFHARIVAERREDAIVLELNRPEEICRPGASSDPDNYLSIWNYIEIYSYPGHQIVHFTDRGQEIAEKAEVYMTELKAWETDERDWKTYQILKRKFEGVDQES